MQNGQFVNVLMGASGIKSVYESTLSAKAVDFVCLSKDYDQVLGGWFDREYATKLKASRIQTREILPDTSGNRADSKSKDQTVNAVRFLAVAEASESDLVVFDSTVALVSFAVENPFAIVISEPQMVGSIKTQFNVLWDRLK